MATNPLQLPLLERQTLNEAAYLELKRALLSGRLEPGNTLTLRQLAEQLGTSMMPVREAVTRLSAENAVEIQPQRGIIIPHLSADEVEDIWNLRIYLEGDASARAAEAANADEVAHIRDLCARVRAAADDGDLHTVLEYNSDFQFAVYQAAKSPVTLQLIEILRMKSVPHHTYAIRTLINERPPYYYRSWDNHDALVAAIAAGDARGARAAKQKDLRELREFVKSIDRCE